MKTKRICSLSTIVIPDEMQQYQRINDLIWSDELREKDVDPIVDQLAEFYANGTITLDFINNLFYVPLNFKAKNEHFVHEIASKFYNKTSTHYTLFQYFHPVSWGLIDSVLIDDKIEEISKFTLSPDLLNRAALYGAIKCFQHLRGIYSSTSFNKETMESAIKGGNKEIIKIVSSKVKFATIENLQLAIICHQNGIVEEILDKDFELFRKIPTIIPLYSMNYKVFLFAIINNIYYNVYIIGFNIILVHVYSFKFFQCIIAYGYKIDFCYYRHWDSYNLLFEALKFEKYELAKFLVEKGADVNTVIGLNGGSTTSETYTPLRLAVIADNIEIAKFLLDHGADKNTIIESQGCFHYCKFTLHSDAKSDEMKALLSDSPILN